MPDPIADVGAGAGAVPPLPPGPSFPVNSASGAPSGSLGAVLSPSSSSAPLRYIPTPVSVSTPLSSSTGPPTTAAHVGALPVPPPPGTTVQYGAQQQPSGNGPLRIFNSSTSSSHPSSLKRSFSAMSSGPPVIYRASYSDVPVYEMEVQGTAVMRRISDSWLNATQILKVAGVDKGKRTKVLEREILRGDHEKVQGGYGKYQGTWVSFDRGHELCRQYGVEEVLRPLLHYDPGPNMEGTPTKEQAMAAQRKRMYAGVGTDRMEDDSARGTFFSNISSTATNALVAMNKIATLGSRGSSRASSFHRWSSTNQPLITDRPSGGAPSADLELPLDEAMSSPGLEPARKRVRADSDHGAENGDVPPFGPDIGPPAQADHTMTASEAMPHPDGPVHLTEPGPLPVALDPLPNPDTDLARDRQAILLDLFSGEVEDSAEDLPDPIILRALDSVPGPDLDTPLDKSANTALHWASTLGKVGLVRLLVSRGANMLRGNIAGHTPLMAAVAVSNCLDHGCFPDLVEILSPLIEVQDRQGRTILHHIVVASGIRGRERSSRYYLEVLLEFLVRSLAHSNPEPGLRGPGVLAHPQHHHRTDLMRFLGLIVNAQDKAGNTALHLAARIGNAGIVQQLLEVLADPHIPNFNGLRPSDFGIPGHEPDSRPGLGPGRSGGRVNNQAIEAAVKEVVNDIDHLLAKTKSSFLATLSAKQALIDARNSDIKTLSAQQRECATQLATIRRARRERAERGHRIANLKNTLADGYARLEMRRSALAAAGDGSSDAVSSQVDDMNNVAERIRHTVLTVQPRNVPIGLADEFYGLSDSSGRPNGSSGLKPAGSLSSASGSTSPRFSLAALRSLSAAYTSNHRLLVRTAAELKQQNGSVEATFRRLVALCTELQEDDVDALLDRLLVAVESDGVGEVAVRRVREFLRRVMG